MEKFRKSFRGYRAADVEQRITELEKKLEEASTHSKALENRFSEAEAQLEKSREELAAKEKELERLTVAYERLVLKQSDKKNEAESIGKIYLKAFESGREIAAAPLHHVKTFLDAVDETAEKSRGEIAVVKNKIGESSGNIAALLSEMKKQTKLIEDSLGELAAATDGIDSTYAMFERIRCAANEEIEKIQTEYEKNSADYMENNMRLQGPGSRTGQDREVLVLSEEANMTSEVGKPSDNIEENVSAADNRSNIVMPEQSLSDSEIGNELTGDTFSDFSDSGETEDSSETATEESAGNAVVKSPEALRGENIFSLINKYRKTK